MGEKRKAVVDKYGYDTKNAATLIRLLRQGIEVLKTGEIQVYRTTDRDFLIDIKTGKFTLNEIQKFADIEFKKLDKAYDTSKVQLDNSKHKINELLVDVLKTELYEK